MGLALDAMPARQEVYCLKYRLFLSFLLIGFMEEDQ